MAEVPVYFKCPIWEVLMNDPVTLADGFTYERVAAEEWLRTNDRSFLSNTALADKVRGCHS